MQGLAFCVRTRLAGAIGTEGPEKKWYKVNAEGVQFQGIICLVQGDGVSSFLSYL